MTSGCSTVPRLLALTKIETVEPAALRLGLKRLRRAVPPGTEVHAISSLAGLNLDPLLNSLKKEIAAARRREKKIEPPEGMAVFGLKEDSADFYVEKVGSRFLVHGRKIETFALKTDFDNFHARQRLLDIMAKTGITKQLLAAGYQDEPIFFGKEEIGRLSLHETGDGF